MTRKVAVRHNGHPGDPTANGDKEDAERHASKPFKLPLQEAFSAADSEYELVSADDIRRRALDGTEW